MHLLVELEVILQEDPLFSVSRFFLHGTDESDDGKRGNPGTKRVREEGPATRNHGAADRRTCLVGLLHGRRASAGCCAPAWNRLRPPANTLDVPCTFASMASLWSTVGLLKSPVRSVCLYHTGSQRPSFSPSNNKVLGEASPSARVRHLMYGV